jgi:hypothetical protein
MSGTLVGKDLAGGRGHLNPLNDVRAVGLALDPLVANVHSELKRRPTSGGVTHVGDRSDRGQY